MSDEEQNQILFGLQAQQKLNIDSKKTALEKLSTIFNKASKNWIEVDFSNWGINGKEDNKFDLIKKSILNKQVIEFTYYNSYGQEANRQVEPLQIWFKDKAWYIKGYCRLKKDYRVFKITRIKDIKILDENFERELPNVTEQKYNLKTVTLELEISKEISYRVYDEFQRGNIIKKTNGDFIVKVEFPENDWVYGYVLSFGEYVKVISPEYFKKSIKERLEKTIKNYL